MASRFRSTNEPSRYATTMKQPTAAHALKRLEPLIGEWESDGDAARRPTMAGPGPHDLRVARPSHRALDSRHARGARRFLDHRLRRGERHLLPASRGSLTPELQPSPLASPSSRLSHLQTVVTPNRMNWSDGPHLPQIGPSADDEPNCPPRPDPSYEERLIPGLSPSQRVSGALADSGSSRCAGWLALSG
jgi:hypothetical protein